MDCYIHVGTGQKTERAGDRKGQKMDRLESDTTKVGGYTN
jgi:hypothetical protein